METLRCPLPTFRLLLRSLAGGRNNTAWARVGVRRAAGGQEWLVRSLLPGLPDGASSSRPEALLRIALSAGVPGRPRLAPLPPHRVVGVLELGDGPSRGQVSGAVVTEDGQAAPLRRVALVGAGMHEIVASEVGPIERVQATDLPFAALQGRWSRTIGALGGEGVWQRLIRLPIAVIGCGRTGSIVASMLAALGIRHLTLIDPDVIEPHNLAEMDVVGDADVGRPKAEAVADHLRDRLAASCGSILPVIAPIAAPEAITAAIGGDVLFSCPDNDAARLAVAIIGALYHRVLVDIGTGIHFPTVPAFTIRNPHSAIRNRWMGADVRLIVPGDGCVLCRGSLTHYGRALDDLINHRDPTPRAGGWHQERAGSLRSLNQLAAALAVRMLEDLVAERIQGSTWARVDISDTGRVTVDYPLDGQPPSPTDCPLCAKAGMGDEGWPGGRPPGLGPSANGNAG